jgi:hypothetical protein
VHVEPYIGRERATFRCHDQVEAGAIAKLLWALVGAAARRSNREAQDEAATRACRHETQPITDAGAAFGVASGSSSFASTSCSFRRSIGKSSRWRAGHTDFYHLLALEGQPPF